MRYRPAITAATLLVVALLLAMPASAQQGTNPGTPPGTQAQPGAQTQPAAGAGEQPAKTYIKATVDELNRFGPRFEGAYIQVADLFSEPVAPESFPADLQRYGVTPAAFFLFRTQRAFGSNMLCIAPRNVKAIFDFFQTPLVPDSPIYMFGRVGPRIMGAEGYITLFYVDSIIRGSEPPPPPKETKEKIKGVTVVLEWEAGGTVLKREYRIPEPNKRYRVPDPHDPSKDIYLTLQY